MTAAIRTVQLRRYELKPGESEAFARWWAEVLVPIRRSCGFRIEFGYLVRGEDEFLWAVSVEGDRTEFDRIEAGYVDSPARARAFAQLPERVRAQHLSFVEDRMTDAEATGRHCTLT